MSIPDAYLHELDRKPRPRAPRGPVMPSLFDAVYPTEEPTTNPNPISGSLVVEGYPEAWSESAANQHESEIRLLIPIAQRLAANAGAEGVTISDIREEATRRGLLPALGKGRALSYLGALGKRAGLVPTDRVRRSSVEGSNGNRQTVWVAREFVREDAA